MPGAAPPSGLSSLAIPTNAQPRAISRSLVIRTRAALALSSSDTALAQPTRTSTIITLKKSLWCSSRLSLAIHHKGGRHVPGAIVPGVGPTQPRSAVFNDGCAR
jgi:hypothetical protein